jgi:hypothetical protein
MNQIIKEVIILPFVLVLVASMALGLQYSNVLASVSNTETDGRSEAGSQESSDALSEGGSDTSDTSDTINEQLVEPQTRETFNTTNVTSGGQPSGKFEETSNASSRIIDKKPTKQLQESDLGSGPQNVSKPLKSGLGGAKVPPTGGKVLDRDTLAPFGINVQTVVIFNSITVHNKHEGLASGDGEYDLVAYVQGKKIDLTSASGPGSGLMDVSQGETVSFKQGNVAITEIPNNIPLSIFTVGHELDACPSSFKFPQNIQEKLPIFFDPGLDWSSAIFKFQHYLNYDLWVCHSQTGNDDEILGTIKEFYDPPSYGVGPHEVKSNNGDFTLRYTISTGEGCSASIC